MSLAGGIYAPPENINNAIKITKYTKQKDSRVKLMIWLKAFTSFWTKKILSWASEAINNIIFQPKVGFKKCTVHVQEHLRK